MSKSIKTQLYIETIHAKKCQRGCQRWICQNPLNFSKIGCFTKSTTWGHIFNVQVTRWTWASQCNATTYLYNGKVNCVSPGDTGVLSANMLCSTTSEKFSCWPPPAPPLLPLQLQNNGSLIIKLILIKTLHKSRFTRGNFCRKWTGNLEVLNTAIVYFSFLQIFFSNKLLKFYLEHVEFMLLLLDLTISPLLTTFLPYKEKFLGKYNIQYCRFGGDYF